MIHYYFRRIRIWRHR